jgi:fatty acid desaturase
MRASRDYSLTGADSRRAVELGLAQADWYRTPVPRERMKELMQRRNGPAIRDTLLWLGFMAAFAASAVLLWFSVWSLLLFAAYGVLYGSASGSRWPVWRWSHTRHHTDTIIVGRDPEILATRPPKLWQIAINFFGLIDVPRAFRLMAVHAGGRITADEAYGGWHHVMTGLTQHAGLADDVTDHRLNSRTVHTAFRELVPVLLRQRHDSDFHIRRQLMRSVAAAHAERA